MDPVTEDLKLSGTLMYLQSSFIQMVPLAAAGQQFDCDFTTGNHGERAGPGS